MNKKLITPIVAALSSAAAVIVFIFVDVPNPVITNPESNQVPAVTIQKSPAPSAGGIYTPLPGNTDPEKMNEYFPIDDDTHLVIDPDEYCTNTVDPSVIDETLSNGKELKVMSQNVKIKLEAFCNHKTTKKLADLFFYLLELKSEKDTIYSYVAAFYNANKAPMKDLEECDSVFLEQINNILKKSLVFFSHECAWFSEYVNKISFQGFDLALLTKYYVKEWPKKKLIDEGWEYGGCLDNHFDWDKNINLIESLRSTAFTNTTLLYQEQISSLLSDLNRHSFICFCDKEKPFNVPVIIEKLSKNMSGELAEQIAISNALKKLIETNTLKVFSSQETCGNEEKSHTFRDISQEDFEDAVIKDLHAL